MVKQKEKFFELVNKKLKLLISYFYISIQSLQPFQKVALKIQHLKGLF